MVDPSKDQFYQQRLSPWGHLGPGYGGHPSLAAAAAAAAATTPNSVASNLSPHLYDTSRLHHSLGGLHPTPPSTTTATSNRPNYGNPYPMHQAALLAAVAASDFSRQHGTSGSGRAEDANRAAGALSGAANVGPLPAHLPRHHSAYHPAYHDPYGYYNNGASGRDLTGQNSTARQHHHTSTSATPATSQNGYGSSASSYGALALKDFSNQQRAVAAAAAAMAAASSTSGLSKTSVSHPSQPRSHDASNGYKANHPSAQASQPSAYPTASFGFPSHNGPQTGLVAGNNGSSGNTTAQQLPATNPYGSYPFDVTKLGYQFATHHIPPAQPQQQQPQQQQRLPTQQTPQPPSHYQPSSGMIQSSMPSHPLALTSNAYSLTSKTTTVSKDAAQSAASKVTSTPAYTAPVASLPVTSQPPPSTSLLRGSLMRPHEYPPTASGKSLDEGPQNGVDMTSRSTTAASSQRFSTDVATSSYLSQLVSAPSPVAKLPLNSRPPPAVLATSTNTFRSPPRLVSPSTLTGALNMSQEVTKTPEESQRLSPKRKAVERPKMPENVFSEPASKKARLDLSWWKKSEGSSDRVADPYNFDEDEDKTETEGPSYARELSTLASVAASAERYIPNVPPPAPVVKPASEEPPSSVPSASASIINTDSPASSPGLNAGGYKFKSALLSRHPPPEPPKLSSKSVPLDFKVQLEDFVEACDRFVDDMNSKPVSISRRASVESFMAAQAAKAARKAEKKAEKEQQKAEAAERRAEREERKEREKMGIATTPTVSTMPIQPSADQPASLSIPTEPSIAPITPVKPEKSPKKRSRKSPKAETPTKAEMPLKTEAPVKAFEPNPVIPVEAVPVLPTALPPPPAPSEISPPLKEEPSLEDIKENEPLAVRKNLTNNNGVKEEKPKKGGTWALPIVPKMPQKSAVEKRKNLVPLPSVALPNKARTVESNSGAKASGVVDKKAVGGGGGLANVWLQAFGAKPPPPAPQRGPGTIKQEAGVDSKEKLTDIKPAKKTYLDIPPEKRRRPKPNFGGLIHFSPDWERAVQKHHEKSRLPGSLVDGIRVC